ncbi:MAG TPA: protease HtpX [Myxococcota bacterium]|nr:protease HtpX [Myxococcota bacterium]
MALLRRLGLFFAVNLLVMVTINVVLHLLGVGPYLTRSGLDYNALAVFCLVWGMGGSFISLLISKPMAKMSMGVQVIDPNTRDPYQRDLVATVHRLAAEAGLPGMPEVGVYDSPEINAFATGATRGSALVAVSSGLLRSMDRDARDGVLGHEVAHIANGDMVTLTLIQGVVNAFAMFLARILAYGISSAMSRDEEGRGSYALQSILVFVFQIVFTLLGSMVVAWFSRWREYRADAGGASLAGRERMISALVSLQASMGRVVPNDSEALAAFKISSGGMRSLLATHPPLEDRIAALRAAR